jgi:hypothetical protein
MFGLLVYVGAMALWASRPWTDTHGLVASPEREPAFAEYHCPSVFGRHPAERGRQILSGTRAEGQTEDPEFPPDGTPCDAQGTHRALFAVDLAAASAGMVLLQRSSMRRRAADARLEAQALEATGV